MLRTSWLGSLLVQEARAGPGTLREGGFSTTRLPLTRCPLRAGCSYPPCRALGTGHLLRMKAVSRPPLWTF